MTTVTRATAVDARDWEMLRQALWPNGGDTGAHADDIARLLADPGDTVNLIARDKTGNAIGFAEASLRHDYVNGCDSSPVAFLEGIYVAPAARQRGVARALVDAIQNWAREQGCTELASDAATSNTGSLNMHHALGFEETEHVVFFRKVLP